jgi:hypothetical protein
LFKQFHAILRRATQSRALIMLQILQIRLAAFAESQGLSAKLRRCKAVNQGAILANDPDMAARSEA